MTPSRLDAAELRRLIRRLFSFLFRHDWQVTRSRIVKGDMMSTFTCSQCGKVNEEFDLLNRRAFSEMYWERGCPGPDRKDPP